MGRSLRAGVPLGLLCLALVVIGALEYRWTDQLAGAEEQRLRAAMAAAGARFADDLAREIGRLMLALRPVPWSPADDGVRHERQIDQWAAEATDPKLLRVVLLASRDRDGWRLRRLDGDRFVDTEWTPDLAPVRARLDAGALGPRPSPLVPEVPAVILRPRPSRPPGPGRDGEPPSTGAEAPVLIGVLDAGVLANAVLPELAERHFAGLEMDAAVVSGRSPAAVVWTSRAGFPGAPATADLDVPLLAASPFDGPHRGPMWGALPPGRPGNGPHPPGPPPPMPAAAWRLLVAHREGSVAAAVERSRRRNLAMGLGGLLLLGASGALALVSGHRARMLARQQVAFVAAVSHELRTPLAAIRSAGQNLADGVVSDPDHVRRYGDMVHREGERLSGLVEQTLALSGMLDGRTSRREAIDVAVLVKEALAEVHAEAPIDVDVPAGLPLVEGDPGTLRGALRNLVDNAVKHGEGQRVLVRASVGAGRRGAREIRLTVEDQGPGIPAAEADRLFEPFYRGARARERRVPGSGLGLAVVREAARALGGSVSVERGAGGRGAAFTLRLPVREARG